MYDIFFRSPKSVSSDPVLGNNVQSDGNGTVMSSIALECVGNMIIYDTDTSVHDNRVSSLLPACPEGGPRRL